MTKQPHWLNHRNGGHAGQWVAILCQVLTCEASRRLLSYSGHGKVDSALARRLRAPFEWPNGHARPGTTMSSPFALAPAARRRCGSSGTHKGPARPDALREGNHVDRRCQRGRRNRTTTCLADRAFERQLPRASVVTEAVGHRLPIRAPGCSIASAACHSRRWTPPGPRPELTGHATRLRGPLLTFLMCGSLPGRSAGARRHADEDGLPTASAEVHGAEGARKPISPMRVCWAHSLLSLDAAHPAAVPD